MEKLPERFVKELKDKALDFDTEHLVPDADGYDICAGDAFIHGALWVLEHFNIQVQYIADGSTSAYGKKENNWKPGI
jgi:hypothetical protein